MSTNFTFLKKIDKDLFEIIEDAEKLYRDEYFEQCMTQTRRFGENVCKNVLGARRTTETTFDAMLATLKDCTLGSSTESKEFVEDLYFLKKHGNKSAHSIQVHKDGIEALECLQRAFEVAVNYCVYNQNASRNILKLQYDIDLLITGKKTKKTLSERYQEEKNKTNKIVKKTKDTIKIKQSHKMNTQKLKTGISLFWIFVGLSLLFSSALLFVIFVLANF